jgi:hypothetical protein
MMDQAQPVQPWEAPTQHKVHTRHAQMHRHKRPLPLSSSSRRPSHRWRQDAPAATTPSPPRVAKNSRSTRSTWARLVSDIMTEISMARSCSCLARRLLSASALKRSRSRSYLQMEVPGVGGGGVSLAGLVHGTRNGGGAVE